VESPAHIPCTHKNEGKGKIRVKGRRKDKKRETASQPIREVLVVG